MPNRCGCANACSCLIVAGDGIAVEGIGTLENPYEITSESSDLVGRVEFTDEGNVDFTTTGVGTLNDPLTVFADAVLATTDLTDVPDTEASEGDLLVWRLGGWVYEQPAEQGASLPPGGTDGQVLTKQSSVDGDALWETLPAGGGGGGGGAVVEPVYFSSRGHTAATSIPHNVQTNIPFDSLVADDGITWNGTQWVIPVAGYYTITGMITYTGAAPAGARLGFIAVNGASLQAGSSTPNTGNSQVSVLMAQTLKLAAGDLVEIKTQQTSGAAVTLSGNNVYNRASITKVPSLAAGGGGVIVERPMAARRMHAAATSILNATITKVPFDTTVYEDGLAWNTGLAAFIAPADGYYDVEGTVGFAANATGARVAYIYVDASMQAAIGAEPAAGAGSVKFAETVKALAGQEISLRVQQTSGVSLALAGSAAYTTISVTKSPQSYSGSAVSTYGEKNYASTRANGIAQSIPHAVATPIAFNLVSFEDGIPWNGVDGYTVPVAGYYQIDLLVTFASMASPFNTGVRGAFITINGGVNSASVVTPASTSQVVTATASATILLSAGDVIRGCAYQTSGAALTLHNSGSYTRINVAKVPAPVINGAAASGVWGAAPLETSLYGTNDIIGREIYIDSKGQLRTKPAGGEIGGGVDLDTMTRTGQWSQTQNADAASGLHYPAPMAGMLEVVGNDAYNPAVAPSMVWQRYTTYASGIDGGGAVYTRGQYSGVWAGWVCTSGPGQPFAMASGVANMATPAANGGVALAITFPTGRFTVPPVVTATASSNGYGAASIAAPTLTGVTLKYYNPTASVPSGVQVSWTAVQMTPTSATG